MASAAVMAAVDSVIAANWTHTPVFAPNVTGSVPADNTAFLTVTYPVAIEAQKSFGAPGSNTFREEGAFRIVLSVPIGTAVNPTATPWATWIDELRALFRGKTFSGVTTFEAAPARITDSSDDGAYFEMSISVAYWFDVLG
jgi:hypothetical protein